MITGTRGLSRMALSAYSAIRAGVSRVLAARVPFLVDVGVVGVHAVASVIEAQL
jgi:hypothetical protein